MPPFGTALRAPATSSGGGGGGTTPGAVDLSPVLNAVAALAPLITALPGAVVDLSQQREGFQALDAQGNPLPAATTVPVRRQHADGSFWTQTVPVDSAGRTLGQTSAPVQVVPAPAGSA